MSDTSTFSRVAQSDNRLYGSRALLVCGFTDEGQSALSRLVQDLKIEPLRLIFAATDDLEITLGALLEYAHLAGAHEPSRMPAALIMAGITESELHRLMAGYRSAGLPWPLWATLTPTSETWTLRALLKELAAERAALAAQSNPGETS